MSKNLATAISKAVVSSLTADLPSAVADKFKVDADEFKEFLSEYLKAQFSCATGKKTSQKTGRMTGYNLYSKEARSKDKSIDFKAIGAQWKALSDEQKKVWNDQAKGAPSSSDNEPNTKKEEAPEEASPPKKRGGAEKKATMKVAYDKSIKKWMVKGTQYFIEGSKNKVIVGKILDKKETSLSQSDIDICQSNGWKLGGEDEE